MILHSVLIVAEIAGHSFGSELRSNVEPHQQVKEFKTRQGLRLYKCLSSIRPFSYIIYSYIYVVICVCNFTIVGHVALVSNIEEEKKRHSPAATDECNPLTPGEANSLL